MEMANDFYGLNLREIAIGIQGAFSGIIILRRTKLKDVLGTIFVGGVTANYVGPAIAQYLNAPNWHDVIVYLCGLGGWTICLGALKWFDLYSRSYERS
jgi:hypothetical protein